MVLDPKALTSSLVSQTRAEPSRCLTQPSRLGLRVSVASRCTDTHFLLVALRPLEPKWVYGLATHTWTMCGLARPRSSTVSTSVTRQELFQDVWISRLCFLLNWMVPSARSVPQSPSCA